MTTLPVRVALNWPFLTWPMINLAISQSSLTAGGGWGGMTLFLNKPKVGGHKCKLNNVLEGMQHCFGSESVLNPYSTDIRDSDPCSLKLSKSDKLPSIRSWKKYRFSISFWHETKVGTPLTVCPRFSSCN